MNASQKHGTKVQFIIRKIKPAKEGAGVADVITAV